MFSLGYKPIIGHLVIHNTTKKRFRTLKNQSMLLKPYPWRRDFMNTWWSRSGSWGLAEAQTDKTYWATLNHHEVWSIVDWVTGRTRTCMLSYCTRNIPGHGMSPETSFLCEVCGSSLRDKVKSCSIWGELEAQQLLHCIKRSQMGFEHLIKMSGCIPLNDFCTHPTGRTPELT